MTEPEQTTPLVLAIDDDPDIHKWLTAMFGERYTIDAVSSVGEAQTALATTRYDLLIVDQQLGDGYGTELLEKLRASTDFATPATAPAIMLTASRAGEALEASHFLGSLAYVCKPIDYAELASALESALATGAAAR